MNKKKSLYDECLQAFSSDFESGYVQWRMMRPSTFSDLIHLKAIDILKEKMLDRQKKLTVDAINLCLKALIQLLVSPILLTDSVTNDIKKLSAEKNKIFNCYNFLWKDLDMAPNFGTDFEPLELIEEVVKYSSLHKKGHVGNSNSFFNHLLELFVQYNSLKFGNE